jgi:gas vesicle protein
MAKSSSKVVLAGIAGLAAGVAIGLLFAPAKGSKTRKKVKKRLRILADLVKNDVTDKMEAIKSAFSGVAEDDDDHDEDDIPASARDVTRDA